MRTRRSVLGLVVAVVAALTLVTTFAGATLAQAGHFVGTPTCTDIVEGTNPGGNVAPGQTFTTTVTGTTGPGPTPRNGQYQFDVTTTAPTAPPGSCPNPMWTATVTDVQFTTATITLLEDSTVSDTITVPVT